MKTRVIHFQIESCRAIVEGRIIRCKCMKQIQGNLFWFMLLEVNEIWRVSREQFSTRLYCVSCFLGTPCGREGNRTFSAAFQWPDDRFTGTVVLNVLLFYCLFCVVLGSNLAVLNAELRVLRRSCFFQVQF